MHRAERGFLRPFLMHLTGFPYRGPTISRFKVTTCRKNSLRCRTGLSLRARRNTGPPDAETGVGADAAVATWCEASAVILLQYVRRLDAWHGRRRMPAIGLYRGFRPCIATVRPPSLTHSPCVGHTTRLRHFEALDRSPSQPRQRLAGSQNSILEEDHCATRPTSGSLLQRRPTQKQ
jgi:hypothetical protein